jgi:hypothetical protein
MDRKTEAKPPTTAHLIGMVRGAILIEYLMTCIHHVYEGLGFVFGFRLNSLLAPLTFGIPLLITLELLYLYQKTSKRFMLVVFSLTTMLWWVAAIGFFDGFYNHTLSVLLYLAGVPLAIMRKIYPTYVPPAGAGILAIPCDGAQFRFCALTPNTVLYEGTGILSFIAACFLTFVMYRLIREQWSKQQASEVELPRPVVVGVSLGLVLSFGLIPLLGSFMTTGRLSFLIYALPLMGGSVLAVVVARVWLRRVNARQPHTAPTEGRTAVGSAPE